MTPECFGRFLRRLPLGYSDRSWWVVATEQARPYTPGMPDLEKLAAEDADDLRDVLLGDVQASLEHEPLSASDKRSLIRATFAAVEGLLSELRQELSQHATSKLSRAQLALLNEERYSIGNSGIEQVERDHQSLKQRVKFTVHVVQQLHPDYKIDFGDAGWQKLLASLTVRDRLMHPRSRTDLDVADSEIQAAFIGLLWFVTDVLDPGRAGLTAYKQTLDKAKMLADALRNWPSITHSSDQGELPAAFRAWHVGDADDDE